MPKEFTRRRIARAAFWLYAVAWTLLLLVPDPLGLLGVSRVLPRAITSGGGRWDLLMHGLGYLLLVGTAGVAYGGRPIAVAHRWLFIGCVSHGATTELLQWAMGTRIGDIVDWAADSVGVLLGVLMLRLARSLFHHAKSDGNNVSDY